MQQVESIAQARVSFESIIHISYNQLRTFLQCPQKYEYQYVRAREWEFIPDYLPFGSAIHSAAEAFYKYIADSGERPPVTLLEDAFIEKWNASINEKVRFKDDPATLEKKGYELVSVFYEQAQPAKIIGVEMPFKMEIVDYESGLPLPCYLVGVFDLIEADEYGNPVVVELKTGNRRYSEGQLEIDLQATLYGYALNLMGYSTTDGNTLVRLDQLLKTKKPALEKYFTLRNEKHYRQAVRIIKQVLHAIEREAYFPIIDWHCDDCPFQGICRDGLMH
jgi:putative RecB family exonuclease